MERYKKHTTSRKLQIDNKRNMIVDNYGGKFSRTPCNNKILPKYNKYNDIIQNYNGKFTRYKYTNNPIDNILQNIIENNKYVSHNVELFNKLSNVSSKIAHLTYNYSIGNYEYICNMLTTVEYLKLTKLLYNTKFELLNITHIDPKVIIIYKTIRDTIIRSLEGLMLASTQYNEMLIYKKKSIECKEYYDILHDNDKLKEYIKNMRRDSMTIFPDSLILIDNIQISSIYLRYIKLHGMPEGLNFDIDLLGKIEQEMN